MIQIDVVMPRLFSEGTRDLQINLSIETGSLTALVGPSGSGKTTLLRLLAGLEKPARGRIVVEDAIWLDTAQKLNKSPQERSIGYVFQDTALFPNMSVRENIQYAAPAGQQRLVDELVEVIGLEAFVDQKPIRLSGGQRQRVALARALVRRPQLLLLDEPFAALDAQASRLLRQTVLKLHQNWGTTTLLVSHHEIDVETLADRVIRLEQGRVVGDERITAPKSQEQITRLEFDESQNAWIVETNTTHIRSTNAAWANRKIGDWIKTSL